MSSSDLARGLQERTARALPAERVEIVDGWWLRHAQRCSWWVSTVLPHGDAAPDELQSRVARAEGFYAGHGAGPAFQISPGVCPDALDAVLAARGYRRGSGISLRTAPAALVAGQPVRTDLRVTVEEQPSRRWFDTWRAVQGNGVDVDAEWDLLHRVRQPSGYACVSAPVPAGCHQVVAVGRAVVDTGWAGVFGMATLPGLRGRGAGRAVLTALARWAGAHRARRMYLQVERHNTAALRLYERSEFDELREYHYRFAGA